MHATDVALFGLALDISGAVLLARGFMVKTLPEMSYESATFFGRNVFLLRSGLLQRTEAWGGAILLFFGFVLQILGSLKVFPDSVPRVIVGWLGLAGLLATAVAVFASSQYAARRIGSRQFYKYKLRNYASGKPYPSATVQDKDALLRESVLYDLPLRNGESPVTYAARLTQRVETLGVKYRSKVTTSREQAESWK
jgi:hypothetical protein